VGLHRVKGVERHTTALQQDGHAVLNRGQQLRTLEALVLVHDTTLEEAMHKWANE
jgi:hypothetical protein